MNIPVQTRRYDLDWLRTIAFSLLIFYHIGMFYVTWGWHVKSQYMSAAAEPLMLTVNPWRLALLFFISGVAIRFVTDKTANRAAFALSRLRRLGLPILGGLFLVVMPQAYFELLQAGIIEPGLLRFYPHYLAGDAGYPIITPTWNHLWYVVYLLAYILIILPVLPWLQGAAEGRGSQFFSWLSRSRLRLLLIVPIPFIFIGFTLSQWYPTTHNLVQDWGNHGHRFSVFMLGYFVAKHDGFWRGVDRTLPLSAGLAMLLWPVWVLGWLPEQLAFMPRESWVVFEIVYAWACILTLLGVAQKFFNADSPLLRYLTSAVFCYYILHQTIIIAVGYWLTPLQLGVWLEFISLLVITLGSCALAFETLKRVPYVRTVFGIQ